MDAGLLKKLKSVHKEIHAMFYGKLAKRFPQLG